MKSRIVLTILTSCLITASLFSVWITIKPIEISFFVSSPEGKSIHPVRLFHARRDYYPFSAKNSLYLEAPNRPNEVFTFKVDVGRIPKIQIAFTNISKQVELSNFTVKGLWDFDLADVKKIVPDQMDVYERKASTLVLRSSQENPTVTIYFSPRAFFGIDVNILLLISISVLVFLFTYQIALFLARVKEKEKCSSLSLAFLCIFFVLLFIPMLNISKSTISEKEKRALATYKGVFVDGALNASFGKDFESWFNDRFFGRKEFLDVYNFFNNFVNFTAENDNVLLGEDNWLFHKWDNGIANYRNRYLLNDEQLSNIAAYLSAIDSWCRKYDKEFYYVIVPDKNKIYGEYFPKKYKKYRENSESSTVQLLKYLRENTRVKVLYLYDTMYANKQNGLLYFKNDTHWNRLGAYYAYRDIMKMVDPNNEQALYEAVEMIESSLHTGDLTNMYQGLEEDDTVYKFPKMPLEYSEIIIDDSTELYKNSYGRKQLFLLRDSFAIDVLPFFALSFQRVTNKWRYFLIEEDLADIKENVDIVILEQVERHIPKLSQFKFLEVQ